MNWKLPVDANIETYHVNTVHRDTAAQDPGPGGARASSSCRQRPLPHAHRHPRRQVDGRPAAVPAAVRRASATCPRRARSRTTCSRTSASCSPARGFVFFITNWPIGADRSTLPRPLLLVARRRRPSTTATLNRDVHRDQPVRAARGPVGAAGDAALDRQRRRSTRSGSATRSGGSTTCTRRSTAAIGVERRARPPPGRRPCSPTTSRLMTRAPLRRARCAGTASTTRTRHDQSVCDEHHGARLRRAHQRLRPRPLDDALQARPCTSLFERAPGPRARGARASSSTATGCACASASTPRCRSTTAPRSACWRGHRAVPAGTARGSPRTGWSRTTSPCRTSWPSGAPHALEPPHLDPWVAHRSPCRPMPPPRPSSGRGSRPGDLADAGTVQIDDSPHGPAVAAVDPARVDDRRPVLGRADGSPFHVTVTGTYRGGLRRRRRDEHVGAEVDAAGRRASPRSTAARCRRVRAVTDADRPCAPSSTGASPI